MKQPVTALLFCITPVLFVMPVVWNYYSLSLQPQNFIVLPVHSAAKEKKVWVMPSVIFAGTAACS